MEKKHSEQLIKLLSCVKNNRGSGKTAQNALKSILVLCNDYGAVKDTIRNTGGLSFLIDFVCSTSDPCSLECGLNALSCAVDENSFNQRVVTNQDVFILVRNSLVRDNISPTLLKSAVLLTSTLLYQNTIAQNMFEEFGCIQCFIDLYEELFPPFMLGHVSVKSDNIDVKQVSTELWQAVNTALCFAMANPLNAQNQEICVKLLPVALKILRFSSYSEIVASVASFLSSLIQDNSENQSLLIEQDGLSVFKHCLEVGVISSMANSSISVSPVDIRATVSIISLIDLCITENENNAIVLKEMGVVALMCKLLFTSFLDNNCKTKILLTLGHFIEVCPSSMKDLLSEGRLKAFLKKSSMSSNDDLLKACQYIIHLMLMHDKFLDSARDNASVLNSSCFLPPQSRRSSDGSVSCITDVHRKRARRRQIEISVTEQSSSASSHEQSHIQLCKVKAERVKHYLRNLDSIPQQTCRTRTQNFDLEQHLNLKLCEKPASVQSGSAQQLGSKYFNKKFGNHHALSKLSGIGSVASSRTKRRSIVSSVSSSRRDQHCKHCYSVTSNCSRHKTCCRRAQHSVNSYQKRSSVQCQTNDCVSSSTGIFLKPTQPAPSKKSVAVQMPTPMVPHKAKEVSDDKSQGNKTGALFVKPAQRFRSKATRMVGVERSSSTFCAFREASVCHTDLVDVVSVSVSGEPTAKTLAVQQRKACEVVQKDSANNGHSSSSSDDIRPCYDILSFPSTKCERHGLINSIDKVWFKPLEEKRP